jgi:hypothetical protein
MEGSADAEASDAPEWIGKEKHGNPRIEDR